MIRRKLTRIEVTLDDTKELDDYFTKSSQITALASSNSASKFSNYNQYLLNSKQFSSLLLSKQYDQLADTSLDSNSCTTTTVTAATATGTSVATASGNAEAETVGTSAAGINTTAGEDRLSFNPQPHNQSSRFQFNQESQQLR